MEEETNSTGDKSLQAANEGVKGKYWPLTKKRLLELERKIKEEEEETQLEMREGKEEEEEDSANESFQAADDESLSEETKALSEETKKRAGNCRKEEAEEERASNEETEEDDEEETEEDDDDDDDEEENESEQEGAVVRAGAKIFTGHDEPTGKVQRFESETASNNTTGDQVCMEIDRENTNLESIWDDINIEGKESNVRKLNSTREMANMKAEECFLPSGSQIPFGSLFDKSKRCEDRFTLILNDPLLFKSIFLEVWHGHLRLDGWRHCIKKHSLVLYPPPACLLASKKTTPPKLLAQLVHLQPELVLNSYELAIGKVDDIINREFSSGPEISELDMLSEEEKAKRLLAENRSRSRTGFGYKRKLMDSETEAINSDVDASPEKPQKRKKVKKTDCASLSDSSTSKSKVSLEGNRSSGGESSCQHEQPSEQLSYKSPAEIAKALDLAKKQRQAENRQKKAFKKKQQLETQDAKDLLGEKSSSEEMPPMPVTIEDDDIRIEYPEVYHFLTCEKGWTAAYGRGLIDWYYLSPGVSLNECLRSGREGIDYCISKEQLLSFVKNSPSLRAEYVIQWRRIHKIYSRDDPYGKKFSSSFCANDDDDVSVDVR